MSTEDKQEDESTQVTIEESPAPIEKIEETETTTGTPGAPENSSDNLDDFDIDAILDEIISSWVPTEPQFPKVENPVPTTEEEKTEENIEEDVSEEEINEIVSKLEEEMTTIKAASKAYEEALDLIGNHPILWPLSEKLLEWETIEIPEFLQDILKWEPAIPDFSEVTSQWKNPEPHKPRTLQDDMSTMASRLYH